MPAVDRYAKSAMITFVGFILVLALLIAGVYFVLLTPGEPNRPPSPLTLDQDPT